MSDKVSIVAAAKGVLQRNSDYAFSDHASCFYKVAPGLEVLSWNILTKCRFKAGRTNNSFNVNEDTEDYISRLKGIRAQIREKLENNPNIAIIALQEAPRDKGLLRLVVPDGWLVAEHTDTENISSADATIINPAVVSSAHMHLPQFSKTPEVDEALTKQLRRYHVVEITYSEEKFVLINVHFVPDYKSDPSAQHLIATALMETRNHRILMLGDYNDQLKNFKGYKVLGGQGLYKSGKIQTDLKIVPIDMCVYNYSPENLEFFAK